MFHLAGLYDHNAHIYFVISKTETQNNELTFNNALLKLNGFLTKASTQFMTCVHLQLAYFKLGLNMQFFSFIV